MAHSYVGAVRIALATAHHYSPAPSTDIHLMPESGREWRNLFMLLPTRSDLSYSPSMQRRTRAGFPPTTKRGAERPIRDQHELFPSGTHLRSLPEHRLQGCLPIWDVAEQDAAQSVWRTATGLVPQTRLPHSNAEKPRTRRGFWSHHQPVTFAIEGAVGDAAHAPGTAGIGRQRSSPDRVPPNEARPRCTR
jgi:hypothetical protein